MKTSKMTSTVMAAAAVIFGLGAGAAMADGLELQQFAIDSNVNIVIASADTHQVLRVEQGGRVTVLAGTGEAGNAGNGGYATDARLERPSGVALDSDGSVLFGDAATGQLHKVDSLSGVISSLDGAATASLDELFIKIKDPNTPQSWYVGTTKTIRWTHNLGKSALFTVAIKRDADSGWETIASDVQAKQISWRVTRPATSKARFRVTQQAPAGSPKAKGKKPALQSDTSDADVQILAGH